MNWDGSMTAGVSFFDLGGSSMQLIGMLGKVVQRYCVDL
jgi:hypothetical protein